MLDDTPSSASRSLLDEWGTSGELTPNYREEFDREMMNRRLRLKSFDWLLYVAFFVLGVGSLFPWNAFITETEYFKNKFCGNPFRDNFESVFGIGYNAANLTILFVLLYVQSRLGEKSMVIVPAMSMALIFTLMAASVFEDWQPGTEVALAMSLVILCGMLSAPFIAGICGIGAQYPSVYLSGVFSGQAFAGVVVSAASLLTAYAGDLPEDFCRGSDPSDLESIYETSKNGSDLTEVFNVMENDECPPFRVDWSAFSYFVVAVVMSVLCLFSYGFLKLYPLSVSFQKQFRHQSGYEEEGTEDDESVGLDPISFESEGQSLEESMLNAGDTRMGLEGNTIQDLPSALRFSLPDFPPTPNEISVDEYNTTSSDVHQETAMGLENPDALENTTTSTGQLDASQYNTSSYFPITGTFVQRPTVAAVLYQIRYSAFAVWFNFLISLSVFPSLVSEIESVHKCKWKEVRLSNDLWTPLLFLLFNLGDFSGRLVAGRHPIRSQRKLVKWSLVRFFILPLFLMTNIATKETGVVPRWLEGSDAAPVLLSFVSGISNGYCQSCAMMAGPKMVSPTETGLASTLMVFALTIGLTAGSLFSFGVLELAGQ